MSLKILIIFISVILNGNKIDKFANDINNASLTDNSFNENFNDSINKCWLCCDDDKGMDTVKMHISDSIEGVILNGAEQLQLLKKYSIKEIDYVKTWHVEKEDIFALEKLVKKKYKKHIEKKLIAKTRGQIELSLDDYLRQYVPAYDTCGNKIIIVSFRLFFSKDTFCEKHYSNYIKRFSLVMDGGYVYFYCKYNVATKDIYYFKYN